MRMIAHSYDSYDHAVRAVEALESAGVPHEDVSLVSGDKDRRVATSVAGDKPENTGAVTGATAGTVLGGGAGLLAGLGLLAIPGAGPVVAAGWLVAALTGAGIGAAGGGLLGSLTGAGIAETDAKTYADHVGRGGTLVTVRAEDGMAAEVEGILGRAEGRATAMAGAMPSPGVATDAYRARTQPPAAVSATATVPEDARAAEGIESRKYAIDRAETERDTVRDANDGVVKKPRMFGTTGPGTLRDNAATRAVDNSLGTNISGDNPSRKI